MPRKKVAIVGVGLIGGSLALRLHEKKISSHIIGVDANESHAREALELELVDEMLSLDDALAAAEVILLAIPVDAVVAMLPHVLDRIQPGQVVIDLASSKAAVLEAAAGHPMRRRFVAAHPMWGTEYSGPAAARPDSFSGKALILVDGENSDTDALAFTRYLFEKIGMRILEMEATSHDVHVAYVSHISHITSFALANTVLKKEKEDKAIFALASAGFESTVRLAKSNAAMWVPIFLQNRKNILEVLEEHISQLQDFKRGLETEDESQIRELILQANTIKRIIQ